MGEVTPAFPFSTFPSFSLNQIHLSYCSLFPPFTLHPRFISLGSTLRAQGPPHFYPQKDQS